MPVPGRHAPPLLCRGTYHLIYPPGPEPATACPPVDGGNTGGNTGYFLVGFYGSQADPSSCRIQCARGDGLTRPLHKVNYRLLLLGTTPRTSERAVVFQRRQVADEWLFQINRHSGWQHPNAG